VAPLDFIHGTNIVVDKGLKVIFFVLFFGLFSVASPPQPGNFSSDALDCVVDLYFSLFKWQCNKNSSERFFINYYYSVWLRADT